MAIMVIVFAALLPQFRAILNSWDSKAAAAETLQNARVLIDHLNRNLTETARITAVSDFTETVGFIEFEDNVGDRLRYDVDANNYVEFGYLGRLSELAGPVSQLQFTCYDDSDLDTPLSPITDANDIRFVKAEATLTNPAAMGRDMTFTAKTYIRTNTSPCTQGLVGWWKLDETSGLSAADSSGQGNDGTLNNMAGDEWTVGPIDGALEFDGSSHYVSVPNSPSLRLTSALTIAGWVKADSWGSSTFVGIIARKGEGNPNNYQLAIADGQATLYLDDGDGAGFRGDTVLNTGQWYHVAGTWDGAEVRIYVNGILDHNPPDSYSWTLGTDTRDLYIGGRSGTDLLDGILDDVRIYDRTLSGEEIFQLVGVVYKQFTKAKAGSDTTSITVSTPSGTSEGDLLIAAVATDGDTSASLAPPGGEGWTEIDIDDRSGEVTLGAWWKTADASESPSHQFTWSASEQAYGWMMRFTGHDPADPIDDWRDDRETSSTPTSPAVTTTVDGCLILRLGGFDDGDIMVDAPGLSGHAAITMDESAAGIAIVGSWTSGLSHTPESGTTRLLVFTAHTEDDNMDMNLSSVTYGGQSMTKVIERNVSTGYRAYVVAYVLDEAGIAAATDSNFQVTWESAPYRTPAYSSVFLQGVDQSSPIGASASNTSTSSTVSTSALSNNGGDMVILAGSCGNTGTYSVNNGFTEAIELAITSADGVAGYKAATGVNETPSITHSSVNRQVIIGFVVQSASSGSGGAVSGGAGYVRQSAAGDSGTSDFSLTASQESVTLTIGIAPISWSGGGCEIGP